MVADQFPYNYVVKEKTYPDGTVIIEEGSKGDWVYVVLEGHVKVKKRTSKGMLNLDTLEEGAVFGEIAFLEKGKSVRSASVIAADGPVRVGVLNSQLLAKDYEALSPHLKEVLRTLIIQVKEASEKLCAIVVALN
jgi:CRP-like cAMP-binding protein